MKAKTRNFRSRSTNQKIANQPSQEDITEFSAESNPNSGKVISKAPQAAKPKPAASDKKAADAKEEEKPEEKQVEYEEEAEAEKRI